MEWNKGLALAAAGTLGAMIFLLRFGLTPVVPHNVEWLLAADDSAFHFLGWQYYRQDTWHWPPGVMQNYYMPPGTSIALTDSIPLLALLLKPLHALLPVPFQYFGYWLLLNYILQGTFAFLLLRTLKCPGPAAFAGTLLFVLSPTFLMRTPHLALTAQWVLLAALWLYAREKRRHAPWWWLGIITVAAGTHAYLAAMVWAIYLADAALALRQQGQRSKVMLTVSLLASWTLLLWYLLGFFSGGGAMAGPDYGTYTFNLLSFFNSSGWSRLLPAIPWQSEDQRFESFAYFGIGIIVLLPLGVWRVVQLRGQLPRPWLPLLAVSLGMAALAVTHQITLGPWMPLDLPVPKKAVAALSILYCSPRFVWPLYYLLILAIVVSAVRTLPHRWAALVLLACALLQCWELDSLIDRREKTAKAKPEWWERSKQLDPLLTKIHRVATVPRSTRELSHGWDYAGVAYRASMRKGIVFEGGNVARKPWKLLKELDARQESRLLHGTMDKDVLYFLNHEQFNKLDSGMAERYRVEEVGGFLVAFP